MTNPCNFSLNTYTRHATHVPECPRYRMGIKRRVERGNYEESLRVLMSYLDVRTEVVRGCDSQGHGGDVEREGGLF